MGGLRHQIHHILGVLLNFASPVFSIPPLSQNPTMRRFRNVGYWALGENWSRYEARWANGPLRNLVETHAPDGTPRDAQMGGLRAPNPPYLKRFPQFQLSCFLNPSALSRNPAFRWLRSVGYRASAEN